MAGGFIVKEQIAATPTEVWAYLTDLGNAEAWMTGIEDMSQTIQGPLEVGTRFTFKARGKERETRVTEFDQGKRIALTSTQAGVTATYRYSVTPVGDGTEATLEAECDATGFWKLLHPLIVFAMRKCDSSQLANLKRVIERRG